MHGRARVVFREEKIKRAYLIPVLRQAMEEREKEKKGFFLSLSIPFFRLLHLAGHDFTCLRALAERPASHEQKGQGKVLYLSYCSSCLP